MIVVGLETSSTIAGIAVIRDRQVMAEASQELGGVHAEKLPGMLERIMGDLDVQWSEVEAFAISIGPGSYTGLRVGLSLVKGLAYVTKRPVAAVPTLDAIAFQVPCCRYPVHVLTDARRGQVYEARYDTSGGWPERQSEFRVGQLEDVLASIEDEVLLVGSGVDAYRPNIVAVLGERACFPHEGAGRLMASSTAFLGLDRLKRGEQSDLNTLEPLYLRKTDFARQPPSRLERTPSASASPAAPGSPGRAETSSE
ncbi:MAG: tRNA (adenosine(37)-N6)-threonylcarbamoyltransferase complex dimerization subunit type 1 TsaB [Gemmatimonadetes bacterium]|nr:tRNA (adenosine(37)-N6)-threonylcarbamoyltransferase complex dimerization subunit type 1 TsaB [Gemmatimonadota bacterium]MYD24231.1 tRNA (adenosine(37)-N6)-threonylcarbamoyltransferase complex dimerization subunit type 1 TsaB [Gemmatimonadota bacterium]MYJ00036.1 tRNA (adenosine(37)-N6)-threonylcarbamoyltransferase complex dimerization subunit type 1 TsaB [Gemmatimonadota bacterium]